MSHEIRSPLNGIIGFSELLGEPDLSKSERERYIEIIVNNGTALIGLLNDIIDISKLESGQVKMQLSEVSPAEMVRSLEDYFMADIFHSHKNITLKTYIPKGLESLKIKADQHRLKQIFVNLIGNAIKFTSVGCIETGIELWGNTLVCYVKDTGIGIAAEDQAAIFDRYKQSGKQKEFDVKGTGLGLAISKALVELMGGNIWLESELEKGSVFYFTIPYKTLNTTAMMNYDEAVSAFPYNWQGRTILIAEDIDFSFLYIETVLKRTGAKILWAQNGRQAVELVRANTKIDVVLMDIHLPVMNGYDATREIKAMRPELPVIAQTAFVLPNDVKQCYTAGCSGYLAKPIRKDLLLRTVSGFLDDPAHNELSDDAMSVYRSKVI
jgi:CheY-like chemotaxis protein